jgi:phosphoenolpyruvate synthase/pyruvate phosphate dikinase
LTIKKAVSLSQETLASSAFCEALDDELLLKIFLDNGVNEEKAKEFTELAKKPSFDSISLTTDKGLLNHKSLNDIQWLFTTYYAALDFSVLEKKVESSINDKGGRKKLIEEVKRVSKEISENKKCLELIRKNISKKERIILDFASFNIRMRDERIEPTKKSMTVTFNGISEYAKRIGLDAKFVPFLFVDEILNKNNSVSVLEEIAISRNKGVVLFVSQKERMNSSIDYSLGMKKMDEFMHKGIDASLLKGSVANKGFVKGTTKIILNEKDFSKFKEGDILVASMTRVEYVPLMKKAGAIVTDEGGITCHAAIVSRELNKPCVIGTKVATRVLKDGDLIEVDANKGIVKKL